MTAQWAGGRPLPSFNHLLRLADDVGVLEHARGPVPRRDCGYCLDDNARALLAVCNEADPAPAVLDLGERALAFVFHAQAPDGLFHNRFGYSRTWDDEASTGDWWGRALWALGAVAARGPSAPLAPFREAALAGFEAGAVHRSPFRRSMAYAGLGAAEILGGSPGSAADSTAERLLEAAVACVGAGVSPHRGAAWPWPEPRLTYANAVLPEFLIAAGRVRADDRLTQTGLDLLAWLADLETHDGHLSPTPAGGWAPGDPRPAFDQQPIEAGCLAGASARAYAVTGDRRWLDVLDRAVAWFLGENDRGVALFDPETGGCFDGLTADRPNPNEGAESTLALIAALQHAKEAAR